MWYTEKQTADLGFSCRVKEMLLRVKSDFQEIAVMDTYQFGRMLVLDGMVQTTDADEYIYHEMITHVPMRTHPHPENVLVIGGGDGGAVREVAKYPQVRNITLVEIDAQVIDVCRRFFPQISAALTDSRVDVRIADGVEFVKGASNSYDLVIVDSTEPVGPAVELFGATFYSNIYKALKEDGILVAQTESPFFNVGLIQSVSRHIKRIFPLFHLYLAPVPTYPGGLWSFTIGSKKYSPLEPQGSYLPDEARYYTPLLHRSCFTLPRFVQELLTG